MSLLGLPHLAYSASFGELPEESAAPLDAEERLRLLERFADAANDVILITEAEPIDVPGPRIVYVNPAFTAMTGYAEAEVLGKSPRILQGADTDRGTLDYIRRQLKLWEPWRAELLNHRKDGSTFWVEINVQPVTDSTGLFTHWIAIQRDISERKRIELRLALDSLALGRVSDAVVATDTDWKVTYWNAAAAHMHELPEAEVIGMPIREAFGWHWMDPTGEVGAMETLARTGSYRGEYIHTLKRGHSFPVESSVSRLDDAAGRFIGYVIVARDISDRKRAEETLEKMNRVLREVLWSVTNKRLFLCDATHDLPEPLPNREATLPLNSTSDLASLRARVKYAADYHGFDEERASDLIAGVHEAAMNALVHAPGGTATIHGGGAPERLQVWIRDHGHGFAPDTLHRATLERGFTTGGGFGYGFPILLEVTDRVYLRTGMNGTTVVVEQARERAEPEFNFSDE